MKKCHLISICLGGSLLFTSCKDINQVEPTQKTPAPAGEIAEIAPAPVEPVESIAPEISGPTFPFNRSVTDAQGRSVDAIVLAKTATEIGIAKQVGGAKFVIPLAKLSAEDRQYFSTVESGGNIEKIKHSISALSGRKATWHRNLRSAENESQTLNIPILLSVLVTDDEASKKLEKDILYNSRFRTWANNNVSLCLLRVDNPKGNRTSSSSAHAIREEAAKYGIAKYSGPSLLLARGEKGSMVPAGSYLDLETTIDILASNIEQESMWEPIEAVTAPKKVRKPT